MNKKCNHNTHHGRRGENGDQGKGMERKGKVKEWSGMDGRGRLGEDIRSKENESEKKINDGKRKEREGG